MKKSSKVVEEKPKNVTLDDLLKSTVEEMVFEFSKKHMTEIIEQTIKKEIKDVLSPAIVAKINERIDEVLRERTRIFLTELMEQI